MNLKTSLKLKKLFITMLSFLLAFCLVFTCACNETTDDDDDDDDTTQEETIADAQILSNGDFEFYTTDETTYPYASSVKWTRSNDADKSTAPTSSYSSGIIDVGSTAYGKLADKNKPVDSSATETTYLNPQTPYYYGLINDAYVEDDEDTHVNAKTSGSKILMIHNKLDSTPNHGTAQYFTSSATLTVPQGGYGKFSVWVKTQDLVSNQINDGKFGAYVLLKNTVNSVSYNDIVFNNINTKGEWSLFETYIKGDELFESTFSVVFGLGQGNGTNHKRFVEGFAYFDNAKFETYTKKEYDALTLPANVIEKDVTDESKYDEDLSSIVYADNGDAKTYNEQNSTYYTTTSYLLNYLFIPNYNNVTTSDANSDYITSVLSNNITYNLSNGNKIGAGSLNSVKSTLSTLSQNALTDAETELQISNPNLIYFDFVNASTAKHEISNLTLAKKTHVRYTFYSKVKITNNSSNKFKVEVIDNTVNSSPKKTAVFSSIGTTTITDGDYGSWIKYDVFIANATDKDVNYSLKFTFGIDEGKIAQVNADLTKGYAFIADLKSYTTQNEDEYEDYDALYSSLKTSTTLYKLNLTGVYSSYEEEKEESETADSYSISVDLSQQFEITKNPVTNIDNNYKLDGIDKTNTEYGIFNTKYLDNYDNSINLGDRTYLKDTLASDKSLQLLLLNNLTDTNSYYETYKSNLAINSVLKVSANVAVVGNSTAYLKFLIKNDDGDYETATINGNDNVWTENLVVTTTSQEFTTLGQKFLTITMYIATGNRSVDYKLQVGNQGQGTVYIENISAVSSDATDFVLDKTTLKDDFATISGLEFTEREYTRLPATVTSLDDDGNEVTSTREFEPKVIFAGNNLYKFIDYTTVDVENTIDETEVEDEETEEETEDPTNPVYSTSRNVALEIISILLSVVLLGVLVTVFIRNLIKNRRSKIETTRIYYSRDSRDKALNAISSKKSKINVEDDDEEYDYTLAEKADEEDVVDEEVIDLDTLKQAPIDESETPSDITSEEQDDDTETASEEQGEDTPTDSE